MSRLEKEEHDNYKKLYKLVFQVGLPVLQKLFLSRYRQNYGNWEDTPEFGEKLLKMLDGQNNIKITEPLENYGRRNDIQNGKMSNWDFTTLYVILTYLNFGNSSTSPSNRFENENKGVRIITQVRNKIAHDYWKEERIPTVEFLKLWTRTCDCCLYLGAEEAEMNNIMKYYQIKSKFSKSAQARSQRSSLPLRKGERRNPAFLFASWSSQSTKERPIFNVIPNFSIASRNNYDIPKVEDKHKAVSSSPSPSKPKPINSIYRQAVMGAVKKSIQNELAAAAIISPAISSSSITFSSPSANSSSFSTTTTTTSTTHATNNKQLDAPKISSPTTFLSPAPNSSSFSTTTIVMSEAKKYIQNELTATAIIYRDMPSPQTAFLSPSPNSSSTTTTTTAMSAAEKSIQNELAAAAIISPAISSPQAPFLSPPANSSSFTTTTTTPSTQDTNNEQLVAPQISSTITPSGQTESPSCSPAQTPPTSETVNTTENSNPDTPETSSTFGTLNSIDNPDTRKEEVLPHQTENETTIVSFPHVLLMFFHGLFLLVVSSLFLSRLMQHSEDSLLLWIIFTLIAVCFGSLKIILALFGFLSMIIKDPKAFLAFNILFGLVHGVTILLFGVLVICFVLTNHYSETFLNRDDVEGRTNYNLYTWLISALSAEAGLVCISIVLLWGFPLCCCIKDALKKYL